MNISGKYTIKIKKENKTIKEFSQKNNLTDLGKKQILDILSYGIKNQYGFEVIDLSNGYLEKDGKTYNYYSSFFGWNEVNHPFNVNIEDSGYKILKESEIAKQVLTQNNTLSEEQSNVILKKENNITLDWGTKSSTSGSNNGENLSSYKVWFNIAIGRVDTEQKVELPINSDTEESISEYEIKLEGYPIVKGSVVIKSDTIPENPIYDEDKDYIVDYDKGIIKIINKELFNNLSESDIINNTISISYTWCGTKYIKELKNGICGVYLYAYPSVNTNSSMWNNNNYFGMGCFSSDLGKTWGDVSFPWRGTPDNMKQFVSVGNDSRSCMPMTGFSTKNSKNEHYYLTMPWTFNQPTDFCFSYCSSGEYSFFIKNLLFIIPEIQPNIPQIIGLGTNDSDEISFSNFVLKKELEWAGVTYEQEDKEFLNPIATWKAYLDTDEGNDIEFKEIGLFFNNLETQEKPGWGYLVRTNENMELFSRAVFKNEEGLATSWTKTNDEMIEISYSLIFTENGE